MQQLHRVPRLRIPHPYPLHKFRSGSRSFLPDRTGKFLCLYFQNSASAVRWIWILWALRSGLRRSPQPLRLPDWLWQSILQRLRHPEVIRSWLSSGLGHIHTEENRTCCRSERYSLRSLNLSHRLRDGRHQDLLPIQGRHPFLWQASGQVQMPLWIPDLDSLRLEKPRREVPAPALHRHSGILNLLIRGGQGDFLFRAEEYKQFLIWMPSG